MTDSAEPVLGWTLRPVGSRAPGGHSHVTVGGGVLVCKEGLEQGHALRPPGTLPVGLHVRLALPQRDRVPGIRVVLVSQQPLVLEAPDVAPSGDGLLVGGLESVPPAGEDPPPDDLHAHLTPPVCGAACEAAPPWRPETPGKRYPVTAASFYRPCAPLSKGH